MKRMGLTALAFIISGYAVGAENINYAKLDKQLRIMKQIFTTSLRDASGKQKGSIGKLEATYLANQGVVFTLDKWRSDNWVFRMGEFDEVMVMPDPPEAPDVDIVREYEFIQEGEHFTKIISESIRESHEVLRESREEWREAREQEREVRHAEKELEREQRDLAYERQNASGEKVKELEKALAKVEKRLKDVKAKAANVEERSAKLKKKYVEVKKRRNHKKLESQKNYIKLVEATMSEVLCGYGNAFRTLPKKQNISFVVKDVTLDNDEKDLIYVFKNSDVKSCIAESISEKELLGTATRYHF